MKILFAAISITAFAAAAVFAVLAIKSRHRAHVGRAVICCCILAVSTVGFVISTPNDGGSRQRRTCHREPCQGHLRPGGDGYSG